MSYQTTDPDGRPCVVSEAHRYYADDFARDARGKRWQLRPVLTRYRFHREMRLRWHLLESNDRGPGRPVQPLQPQMLVDQITPDQIERARREEAEHAEVYPEHAKLEAVKDDSQTIGLFLDSLPGSLRLCEPWLSDEGLPSVNGWYLPTSKSIEKILAEYYGIDLKKLQEEKHAMLEAFREANRDRTH